MNCLIYARVSTLEQAERELSIPAQLAAMRQYAAERQWAILEEFVEAGVSAKTADRPVLRRLLSRCRDSQHDQVEVVLVHKVDRLARNVADHAAIRMLLQERHIKLASVSENLEDSTSGQLVENIMAAIAEFYSANLADEVKKGMRQKVLKGGWPHKPPRGYVVVRTSTSSVIEIHPVDGPLVRQAFELYATGLYSLHGLSESLARAGLTAEGSRPMATSYVRRLLSNVFYIGRLQWQDLEVAGKHPVLVSMPLFEQVQTLLKSRYRDVLRGDVTLFPLRAVARCSSCRGRMTGERHGAWSYYRCSRQANQRARCSARYTNAKRAEADFEKLCREIALPPGLTASLEVELTAGFERRAKRMVEQARLLEVDKATLLTSEMRLTEAYLSGDISPDAHHLKADEIRDARHYLERRLSATHDVDDLRERSRQLIANAASLWDLYRSAAGEGRIELLRAVFGSLLMAPEGLVGFTLTPAFDQMLTMRSENGIDERAVDGLIDALLEAA